MWFKVTFAPLLRKGCVTIGLLGLIGCDYWPPASQSEIESLHSLLQDALDDRQRLDAALSELQTERTALQRDVEEKAMENADLRSRLAAHKQDMRRPAPAAGHQLAAPESNRRPDGQIMPSTVSTAPPKSTFAPLHRDPVLRRDQRVLRLQRLLQAHGFRLHADGIFGRETESAVRRFQQAHGLPVDGIVGPATSVRLHRGSGSADRIQLFRRQPPPRTDPDVAALQRSLKLVGYSVHIDGRFGPETHAAVVRFQRTRGLAPDGVVGPRTWHALTRAKRWAPRPAH